MGWVRAPELRGRIASCGFGALPVDAQGGKGGSCLIQIRRGQEIILKRQQREKIITRSFEDEVGGWNWRLARELENGTESWIGKKMILMRQRLGAREENGRVS